MKKLKLNFMIAVAVIAAAAGATSAMAATGARSAATKSAATQTRPTAPVSRADYEDPWMSPYMAFRVSYIHINVDGGQTVYAAPGGVIGAEIAHERFDIDNKDGFGFKIAFGGEADIPSIFGKLRVEAEYADNGSYVLPVQSVGGTVMFQTLTTTIMANAYYALNTGTRWSPYVGLGFGFSHFTPNVNFESGAFNSQFAASDYTLGHNVSAGLSLYLARNATLDLGYRFSNLGTFHADMPVSRLSVSGGGAVLNGVVMHNKVDMTFYAHEINLGVRYRF